MSIWLFIAVAVAVIVGRIAMHRRQKPSRNNSDYWTKKANEPDEK